MPFGISELQVVSHVGKAMHDDQGGMPSYLPAIICAISTTMPSTMETIASVHAQRLPVQRPQAAASMTISGMRTVVSTPFDERYGFLVNNGWRVVILNPFFGHTYGRLLFSIWQGADASPPKSGLLHAEFSTVKYLTSSSMLSFWGNGLDYS